MMSSIKILLEKLICLLIGSENSYGYLGDIREIYAEIEQTQGSTAALLWYMKQFMILLPQGIANAVRQNLKMLRNYLLVGFRNIMNHKSYSLINISGLAVGMACCILIGLWINKQLNYDVHYENLDKLYRLSLVKNEAGNLEYADRKSSYPAASALMQEFPEVENAAHFLQKGETTFKQGDLVINESGVVYADQAFLEIFSFTYLLGSPEQALTDLNSIILTKSLAEKYFGNSDPLGKEITLDNRLNVTVRAVIEDLPNNTHFSGYYTIKCLIPFALNPNIKAFGDLWDAFYHITYVQLTQDADHTSLNQKLEGYLKSKNDKLDNYDFMLQPIKNINLYGFSGEWTGMTTVVLFSSLAILIMLIASVNYMSLTTAFSLKRGKEIGIRKVFGAHRGGIMRQFLSESILISLLALIFASLLVTLVLPYFNELTGQPIRIDLGLIVKLLPWTLLMAFMTGLVSGSFPALYLSLLQPVNAFKSKSRASANSIRLRRFMVIFQISISTALIIGSFTAYKQYQYFITQDDGINPRDVIVFQKQRGNVSRFESFRKELASLPMVESVGSSQGMPGYSSDFATRKLDWEGKEEEFKPTFHALRVGYDYFETLEIDFLEGRAFQEKSQSSSIYEVVINAKAAEMMDLEEPLNATIYFMDNAYRIIGITENTPLFSYKYGMYPVMTVLAPERTQNGFVKLKSGENRLQSIEEIKQIWQNHYPELPFDYMYMEDINRNLYGDIESLFSVFSYFTMLSVFICFLGMYSLISFLIRERSKEVCLRKILGARKPSLFLLLSRESIKCVLIANVITLPIAGYYLNKWLENYSNRIELAPELFILTLAFTLLIVLIPIVSQIINAIRSNPVDSLRYE